MKKNIIIVITVLLCSANLSFCQDMEQSQVPSIIVNKFEQEFTLATDIDWEMDGELYNVEFEIDGVKSKDHEIWYDHLGKKVKHKEKIGEGDLPTLVRSKISSDFSSFKIDDAKKIVEGNSTTFKIELDSDKEELEVIFNSQGEIISKVAD